MYTAPPCAYAPDARLLSITPPDMVTPPPNSAKAPPACAKLATNELPEICTVTLLSILSAPPRLSEPAATTSAELLTNVQPSTLTTFGLTDGSLNGSPKKLVACMAPPLTARFPRKVQLRSNIEQLLIAPPPPLKIPFKPYAPFAACAIFPLNTLSVTSSGEYTRSGRSTSITLIRIAPPYTLPTLSATMHRFSTKEESVE